MNQDTRSLVQYLEALTDAVRGRGVAPGSFRAEAINAMREVNRDPDMKGDTVPTGRTMITVSWTWADPVHTAMQFTSEGDRIDMSQVTDG